MPGVEVAEMMNILADPGVMGDSYKKKEKKKPHNIIHASQEGLQQVGSLGTKRPQRRRI